MTDAILLAYKDVENSMERFTQLLQSLPLVARLQGDEGQRDDLPLLRQIRGLWHAGERRHGAGRTAGLAGRLVGLPGLSGSSCSTKQTR